MRFLQSTYRAAADLGDWDVRTLECGLGVPDQPRVVGQPLPPQARRHYEPDLDGIRPGPAFLSLLH